MSNTPYLDYIANQADNSLSTERNNAQALLDRIDIHGKETRPSYFSSSLKREVQISEDSEAFLISISPSVKEGLISWVSAMLASETGQGDLELMGEIIENRRNKLDVVISEFGSLSAEYSRLRNLLVPPVDMIEISSSLATSNTFIAPLIGVEGEYIHDLLSDTFALEVMDTRNNDNLRKELESWGNIFTAYLR